jgi:hypothetical protein
MRRFDRAVSHLGREAQQKRLQVRHAVQKLYEWYAKSTPYRRNVYSLFNKKTAKRVFPDLDD